VSQVIGFLSPLKKIDYASHLMGILAGLVTAEWWKRNEEESAVKRDQKKTFRWYEVVLGKSA